MEPTIEQMWTALRNLMLAADRERTADMDDAEAAAKLYMQRREEALALLRAITEAATAAAKAVQAEGSAA